MLFFFITILLYPTRLLFVVVLCLAVVVVGGQGGSLGRGGRRWLTPARWKYHGNSSYGGGMQSLLISRGETL